MTLDMQKGEAASASPLVLPDVQSPPNDFNALRNDTRPRVVAELLAPDLARRMRVALLVRSCPMCRHAHLFRSENYAASYERNLPCTGRRSVVLVTQSFHLRQVAA